MKFRPIDRVQSLSRLEFAAYIKDAKAPLVLTGAMDNWRAMREWSLDFFKDTFPDFPVVAHAPQFPALRPAP